MSVAYCGTPENMMHGARTLAGPTALVWFKRNLRVRDHAPLAEAMHFESVLGLVVIEPQWLQSPECNPRHVGFLLDCVAELQHCPAASGMPLMVRTGAKLQVLQALRREFAQIGVVRRLRSRTGWAGRWAQRMNAPKAPAARGFAAATGLQASALPTLRELGLPAPGAPLPPGGERAAWAELESFLDSRGRDNRRAMSSPLTATEGCSRLSAHLAFGTIPMRCLHQATEARSVDGLRAGNGVHQGAIDRERLQAWCEGRTGFQMVDTCMRQLRATGWLNLRMRATTIRMARTSGNGCRRSAARRIRRRSSTNAPRWRRRKSGLPPTAATKRGTRAAPDGQGQLFQPSLQHPTMTRSS